MAIFVGEHTDNWAVQSTLALKWPATRSEARFLGAFGSVLYSWLGYLDGSNWFWDLVRP
jgi:hypothetical protein